MPTQSTYTLQGHFELLDKELAPSMPTAMLVSNIFGSPNKLSLVRHYGQVDGSVGYEWTQAATDGALAVPNPLDTAPDNTLEGLSALIFNLLTQDTAQQGSALNTLAGLVADSADRSLFLLNGDVCYARCASQLYLLPWSHALQSWAEVMCPSRDLPSLLVSVVDVRQKGWPSSRVGMCAGVRRHPGTCT